MFDPTAVIEVSARNATGVHKIEVRWPTDEEWTARMKARKVFFLKRGRGASETVVEMGEADNKLYEKIRCNGGPELKNAEATRMIEALAFCEVCDVEVEGSDAKVSLNIITGSVVHSMRLPTADEVIHFRRSATRLIDLPYNRQELRISVDAGARLWDACGGKSDDYTAGVPLLHKDTAIRGAIDFLDREAAGNRDEDF